MIKLTQSNCRCSEVSIRKSRSALANLNLTSLQIFLINCRETLFKLLKQSCGFSKKGSWQRKHSAGIVWSKQYRKNRSRKSWNKDKRNKKNQRFDQADVNEKSGKKKNRTILILGSKEINKKLLCVSLQHETKVKVHYLTDDVGNFLESVKPLFSF